jgi:hypothetical protein
MLLYLDYLGDFMNSLRQWIAKLMQGRYGMDKLNRFLLWTSVITVLVGLFLPWPLVRLMLTVLSYLIMGWVIFRSFSRQTYRRYEENLKFLRLLDREHRYFSCPRCRQPVRVPRGKGKIAITCPKCREKFIKKT